MLDHKNPFSIRLLVLLAALLTSGIVGFQVLSPSILPDNLAASNVQAYQDKASTDAIQRALLVAQTEGLTDKPDAMYIARDTFKNFEDPGEAWPIWDARTVWAVPFDKHFELHGMGMLKPSPADHLVVFIDEQTGTFAGVRAGLPPRLQTVDWTPIPESDIGSFPVGNADMPPEWYGKSPAEPGVTDTPHQK